LLLVGVIAGLLAAPAGASAAVQPDAVLTVRYTDAVTLLPVDGAAVTVTAWQGGELLAELSGTTGADGVALVEGLPIETGEGAPVVVDVVVDKASMVVDEASGCTFSDSWHAERHGVAVDATAIDIEFAAEEQSASSLIDCEGGPEPTGEVGGISGTPNAPKATLPSTDTLVDVAPAASFGLVVVGGLLAFSVGLLLVIPRPRRATAPARIRR
jgi:hypothetical protein